MIIYEQLDVTAADGDSTVDVAFTSTNELRRTLKMVQINDNSSDLDLLVYDERELIADIPCDINPFNDKWIEFDRPIEVGHQVKLGIRNNTGGSVTAAISYATNIEER